MKQQENNYMIVTALIQKVNKTAIVGKNKRPVMDVEIVREHNGEFDFITVPVIICDILLSKTFSGFKPGEIITIEGALRSDLDNNLCIEAKCISRIEEKITGEKREIEYAISRLKLASMVQKFNICCAIGKLNWNPQDKENTITLSVKNDTPASGLVDRIDNISFYTNKKKLSTLKQGKQYCCIGTIGLKNGNPTFYVDNPVEIYV